MILPIKNRDNFIKNFLNPVSRLAPNCTLDVDDKLSTVVHNNSNIFLKAEYKLDWDDHSSSCLLCLPDTIKLIKILSCLDEDSIDLKVEENCITYNNNNNRFKYHLFDDSLSLKSPFDFDKIKLETTEILYAGILSGGAAFALQLFGQKNISAAPAAIVMSLEGVVAAVSAWIILSQILGINNIIGCLLILSGVLLSQLAPIYEKKL